ncbi:MAG: DUF3501 family protein [Candidatus Marinimicrobia bacterium]|nr:DUF3501 family protein [Candidatus Neomarinimicrobiota bacterium]
MKTLNKESLLDIIEYEKIRHDYRKEIIDYKINRRIALGPNVTMVFENEKTLSFQIQEIMRAERLVHDEQIQEEIEVYNSIMPPSGGLSATLFIEITDEKKIKSVLNDFIGLTNSDNLYFEIGDEKVFARFEGGREKEDKISSVHYVQFYLNQNQKDRLADLSQTVNIVIDYKNYVHSVSVKDEMRQSLVNDL